MNTVGLERLRSYHSRIFGAPRQGHNFDRKSLAFFLLGLATLAAALSASSVHRMHDADSVITSIMSLQKVTWYYWGQNRYANVFPFMTAWIGNIETNFKVQVFLRAFTAMSIPGLVLVFTWPQDNLILKYVLALTLTFITFSPRAVDILWIQPLPFGPSVFFLLWAVIVNAFNPYSVNLTNVALAVTTLCLLGVAFLLNNSLILIALPLACGAYALRPHRQNSWFAGSILLAFAATTVHAHLYWKYGFPDFCCENYAKLHFVSVADLTHVYENLAKIVSLPLIAAEFLSIALSCYVLQRAHRASSASLLSAPVARALFLLAACVLSFVVVLHIDWVRRNLFAARYFLLSMAIIPSLAVVLAMEVAELGRRIPSRIYSVGTVAAVILGFYSIFPNQFGSIDPRAAVSYSDDAEGHHVFALADLAERHNATFIAGDFWTVWPTVFDTIRRKQIRGDFTSQVYGLTYRGYEMMPEISEFRKRSTQAVVLCAEIEMPDCESWMQRYQIGFDGMSLIDQGELPQGGHYRVLLLSRASKTTAIGG